MKPLATLAIGVLTVAASVIGLVPRDPTAGAAFSIVWAFALSFVAPRLTWLWVLLLSLWLPLGVITRWLPDQPNGWPGCPHGVADGWQIALAIFIGIAIFAAGGAFAGVALTAVLRMHALRDITWLRFVKPVLDWGGCALAGALVVYAGLALAQPLRPFAPGETYCWDEFCFRVDAIERARAIGYGPERVAAQGTFYIVSATLEAPWWGRFEWGPQSSFVLTRDGAQYEVSPQGQRAMDARTNRPIDCHLIRGASEHETLVFDLPDDALQPRLLVRDTLGFEGFIGALRLGRLYVKPAFNLRYD